MHHGASASKRGILKQALSLTVYSMLLIWSYNMFLSLRGHFNCVWTDSELFDNTRKSRNNAEILAGGDQARVPQSLLDSSASLKDFIERYKGVDMSVSAKNTILFSVTTKETVNTTLNCACWLRALDLKFFVWAADEEAHRYLTARGVPTYFQQDITRASNVRNVQYNASEHNERWARAGFFKMHAVLNTLTLGYDAFLLDVDVIMLKNPWPHFVLDADLEYHVEVSMSEVEIKEDIQINMGFILAKSNDKTIDVFNRTLRADRTKGTIEQNVFNSITRGMLRQKEALFLNFSDPKLEEEPSEQKLIMRMKPILEFPSGGIVFHTTRRNRYLDKIAHGLDPVMTHFNLISGGVAEKENCMQKLGYWRYRGDDNTCASEVQPDYTNRRGCQ